MKPPLSELGKILAWADARSSSQPAMAHQWLPATLLEAPDGNWQESMALSAAAPAAARRIVAGAALAKHRNRGNLAAMPPLQCRKSCVGRRYTTAKANGQTRTRAR